MVFENVWQCMTLRSVLGREDGYLTKEDEKWNRKKKHVLQGELLF